MDVWSLFSILVAVAHCAREGEEQLLIKLVMCATRYILLLQDVLGSYLD